MIEIEQCNICKNLWNFNPNIHFCDIYVFPILDMNMNCNKMLNTTQNVSIYFDAWV